MAEARRLLDFDDAAELAAWRPIDDVVMGGVSRSSFKQAATGIAIFSGTLYVLALTNVKWLGAITPIGGVCLLAGWLTLGFGKPDSKSAT